MALPRRALFALRLATLLAFAVAVGLLVHRFHRPAGEAELRRYVSVEVPALRAVEAPIDARLGELGRAPGPTPEAARALLVDDVTPRLLKLRRQADGFSHGDAEVRALAAQYAAALDALIDACRAAVRVIDDPKLPAGAGLVLVRERFTDVRRAFRAWEDAVRATCRRRGLIAPHTR